MSKSPMARRPDAQWTDAVAVQRYLDGKEVGRPLTYAERGEVARQLHQRFVETTARRLRVKPADVQDALLTEHRRRERERDRERRHLTAA